MNPLMLAFLVSSGQAPKPEAIEAAKKLIEMSIMPVPMDAPGMGAPPVQPGMNEPPPPGVGEDNAQWGAMDRINKRVIERDERTE